LRESLILIKILPMKSLALSIDPMLQSHCGECACCRGRETATRRPSARRQVRTVLV